MSASISGSRRQPIEEPDNPAHLNEIIDWIGWDRLMFSTDYPHWDFDDPRYAFKFNVTEAQKRDDVPRQREGVVRPAMSAACRRDRRRDPAGRASW